MRLIGLAERTLEKMCRRAESRVAFGRPVADQTVTLERIASTPAPTRLRKQIYGHYFIKPYEAFNDRTEFVSIGRDWGRFVPGWAAEFRLGSFAVEMIYPRAMKAYASSTAPSNAAACCISSTPLNFQPR
jgi:hypothetical protein